MTATSVYTISHSNEPVTVTTHKIVPCSIKEHCLHTNTHFVTIHKTVEGKEGETVYVTVPGTVPHNSRTTTIVIPYQSIGVKSSPSIGTHIVTVVIPYSTEVSTFNASTSLIGTTTEASSIFTEPVVFPTTPYANETNSRDDQIVTVTIPYVSASTKTNGSVETVTDYENTHSHYLTGGSKMSASVILTKSHFNASSRTPGVFKPVENTTSLKNSTYSTVLSTTEISYTSPFVNETGSTISLHEPSTSVSFNTTGETSMPFNNTASIYLNNTISPVLTRDTVVSSDWNSPTAGSTNTPFKPNNTSTYIITAPTYSTASQTITEVVTICHHEACHGYPVTPSGSGSISNSSTRTPTITICNQDTCSTHTLTSVVTPTGVSISSTIADHEVVTICQSGSCLTQSLPKVTKTITTSKTKTSSFEQPTVTICQQDTCYTHTVTHTTPGESVLGHAITSTETFVVSYHTSSRSPQSQTSDNIASITTGLQQPNVTEEATITVPYKFNNTVSSLSRPNTDSSPMVSHHVWTKWISIGVTTIYGTPYVFSSTITNSLAPTPVSAIPTTATTEPVITSMTTDIATAHVSSAYVITKTGNQNTVYGSSTVVSGVTTIFFGSTISSIPSTSLRDKYTLLSSLATESLVTITSTVSDTDTFIDSVITVTDYDTNYGSSMDSTITVTKYDSNTVSPNVYTITVTAANDNLNSTIDSITTVTEPKSLTNNTPESVDEAANPVVQSTVTVTALPEIPSSSLRQVVTTTTIDDPKSIILVTDTVYSDSESTESISENPVVTYTVTSQKSEITYTVSASYNGPTHSKSIVTLYCDGKVCQTAVPEEYLTMSISSTFSLVSVPTSPVHTVYVECQSSDACVTFSSLPSAYQVSSLSSRITSSSADQAAASILSTLTITETNSYVTPQLPTVTISCSSAECKTTVPTQYVNLPASSKPSMATVYIKCSPEACAHYTILPTVSINSKANDFNSKLFTSGTASHVTMCSDGESCLTLIPQDAISSGDFKNKASTALSLCNDNNNCVTNVAVSEPVTAYSFTTAAVSKTVTASSFSISPVSQSSISSIHSLSAVSEKPKSLLSQTFNLYNNSEPTSIDSAALETIASSEYFSSLVLATSFVDSSVSNVFTSMIVPSVSNTVPATDAPADVTSGYSFIQASSVGPVVSGIELSSSSPTAVGCSSETCETTTLTEHSTSSTKNYKSLATSSLQCVDATCSSSSVAPASTIVSSYSSQPTATFASFLSQSLSSESIETSSNTNIESAAKSTKIITIQTHGREIISSRSIDNTIASTTYLTSLATEISTSSYTEIETSLCSDNECSTHPSNTRPFPSADISTQCTGISCDGKTFASGEIVSSKASNAETTLLPFAFTTSSLHPDSCVGEDCTSSEDTMVAQGSASSIEIITGFISSIVMVFVVLCIVV